MSELSKRGCAPAVDDAHMSHNDDITVHEILTLPLRFMKYLL
jgi:hypothetical protein